MLALLLTLGAVTPHPVDAPPPTWTLLFAHDREGELDPCG